MRNSATATVIAALSLLLMISSCEKAPQSTGPKYGKSPVSQTTPIYHFAVHPLHNPAQLMQEYQPLMDYLNERLKGARLTLEASRNYASFEEKYQGRKTEFLLPNPWQTLQAMKAGYSVIAEAGEPKDFKGMLIVRKDGGIGEPSDLKGKAVSYPSPTALAACIMPQYFLHVHGINVNKDIENHYVGSQESSIMNVYLKMTAAGATWPPPWRAFQKDHPEKTAELKVAWETEPLINNSVMARNDVPAAIREQLRKLLTGLHETENGKEILANMETARFIPASDRDYDMVCSYIGRFETEVRKVETNED
ncbi:MAG: phosphate/phosphite/phosphonate ABC transporter substrate-binding protein [Victivallales bacterium]